MLRLPLSTRVVVGTAAGVAIAAYAWRQPATRRFLQQLGLYQAPARIVHTKPREIRLFDKTAFEALLSEDTEYLGRSCRYWDSTESTMLEVKSDIAAQGAMAEDLHGTIYLAETQTGGIARRQRSWLCPRGNLYVSFVWAPIPPYIDGDVFTEMKKLNIAVSVAVALAANSLGVQARVKWPNDIWVGDRKLSGMLVDWTGALAVVGIGINCNAEMQKMEDVTATSLADELGTEVSREEVLAKVCGHIERLMQMHFSEVRETYEKLDMIKGRVIRVHHGSRGTDTLGDYDAEVLGYDEDGALRVKKLGANTIHSLNGEEVSIRPQQQGTD